MIFTLMSGPEKVRSAQEPRSGLFKLLCKVQKEILVFKDLICYCICAVLLHLEVVLGNSSAFHLDLLNA